MIETEVAIIGAGAAGLSAAAAAAQQGLQVLVLERMGAGGQVMNVERIANFPGHPDISGFELGPLLQERAEEAGAQFLLDTVQRLEGTEGQHLLHCESGETVRARAVVVAAGSARRKLGVPGEEALEGRGVSECASCDGPLFRGQAVCVVGGGDSAFGEAQVLALHAERVTLVFREPAPIAQASLVEAVLPLPNVHVLANAEVVAVTGEQAVTGVRLRLGDGGEQEIDCTGVFVYAGLQADSGFLAGALALDGEGRIVTDAHFGSSVPGVFAAGDIRSGAAYLLEAAARDGAAAAQAVVRYLNDRRQA